MLFRSGLTLFSIDLYFASEYFVSLSLPAGEMNFSQFMSLSGSWRVLIDLVLIGLFGGFYTVPLSAMVQKRSNPLHRARVIAANNILSALFMVISAIGTVLLLQAGFSISQIFLGLGLLNIVVVGILFILLPEFLQRFVVWLGFR